MVLAHGLVFKKESWYTQALMLEERGLKVLAIDFRGYGKSRAGKKGKTLSLVALAAFDYLKAQGAEKCHYSADAWAVGPPLRRQLFLSLEICIASTCSPIRRLDRHSS